MADAIAGKTNMIPQPQPQTTRPNSTPSTETAALLPEVSWALAKAWIRQMIAKNGYQQWPDAGNGE